MSSTSGWTRSAYYWLRIAEERSLTEDLKSKMKSEELESLEHNITAAVERNKLLTIKRSSEFIKRSTASAS